MIHNFNKHSLFIIELETFLTEMSEGKKPEEIKLKEIFYNVIENLSLLDSTFNIEVGMDLTKHILVPKGGVEKAGILFSDDIENAIQFANVKGTGKVPENLIKEPMKKIVKEA